MLSLAPSIDGGLIGAESLLEFHAVQAPMFGGHGIHGPHGPHGGDGHGYNDVYRG